MPKQKKPAYPAQKKSSHKTSTTPKYGKLRPDYEKFAREYVTNGNNAAAAARTTWPGCDKPHANYARVKATRVLASASVQQYIRDLSADNGLTLNKCLNRLNQRIDMEDNQQIKAIQTWLDLAGYTDRRQQDEKSSAPTINLIGNDALDRLRQVAEDRIRRPESDVERRSNDDTGLGSPDAEIVD